MCGKDNARSTVHSRQLFHRNRIAHHIEPGSAVLFRIRDSHQVHLSHFLYGFRWKLIILVHHKCLRLYLCLGKSADLFPERFMGVCCLKIHRTSSFSDWFQHFNHFPSICMNSFYQYDCFLSIYFHTFYTFFTKKDRIPAPFIGQ